MAIKNWFNVVEPITNLIDDLFTSDEERQAVTNELKRIENTAQSQVLELEGKIVELQGKVLEAKSQIITAEANGESWLQRNWRPITMLTFLVLVCFDSFGWLAFRLSAQAWDLLQLGIGGYVIGRTVEKAAPSVKQSIKNVIEKVRKPH
ncbi:MULTISPECIES: 3TM-type holin [unclassified Pseudoalteromonas]|uniref:3TM-type holin n=1 Tax=unclassified Pseudoalteromonas TaxID=194690 RepID=UPI0003F4E506|nr:MULTISPECIES: 3TM-type holin [unclassified Pseudoalteromonas]